MLSPSGYDTNASIALYHGYAHYLAGGKVTAASTAAEAATQRPSVLAFYVGGGPRKFWTDFDWDVVTHLVIFGVADKEMMAHAQSKGAKVLSGLSFARDMANETVRHGLMEHALSLSYQHPPWDGIFVRCHRSAFGSASQWKLCSLPLADCGLHDVCVHPHEQLDSECTEQPCPWLEPEQIAGEATWLSEVKTAWPTGYISMCKSRLPWLPVPRILPQERVVCCLRTRSPKR